MNLIKDIAEIKPYVRYVKSNNKTLGLVPTMGYLHEGHLALVREAKQECDVVIVSIFVNPMQFGVNEDYDQYPRDLSRDMELAESAGADAVFAPEVKEMYPKGYATYVEVNELTDKLCGLSRPGHFKGVTTVVNKLFNILEPDIAYFGQKDAQQVLVIKKMVSDLNMSLRIKVVETVREPDGLAMSSRNAYLSERERLAAGVLYKSLVMAKEAILSGVRSKPAIVREIKAKIQEEPLARIDYIDLLQIPELNDVDVIKGEVLIALAVFIGETRLIDNFMLEVD